jgi:hypothetical protein
MNLRTRTREVEEPTLQQKYQEALQVYELEEAKLRELEDNFGRQMTQKISLQLFQSLEGQIRLQAHHVEQARLRRDQAYELFNEEQGKRHWENAAAERRTHLSEVADQIRQKDTELAALSNSYRELPGQILIAEGARADLLRTHAKLEQELADAERRVYVAVA